MVNVYQRDKGVSYWLKLLWN